MAPRLVQNPTPLMEAPRLAAELGVRGRILIKRDDLTGFAVAGNKARTLEPLIGDALARESTILVTGGTAGSNFCQGAAAAAAWASMRCVLVMAGEPTSHPNLAAARAWGAEIAWTGNSDRSSVDEGIEQAAETLRTAGERPYVCPRGGATPLGATGFHRAALELAEQLGQQSGAVQVVVATGSGGTLAGLVSGHVSLGRPWSLIGASVSRPPDETATRVLDFAKGAAQLMGTESPWSDDVTLVDARGPGHGLPSPAGDAVTEMTLRAEGLVLDPVYSAKALAVTNQILGPRREDPKLTTVFWHTGGLLDAVAGWEHHDD